MIGFVLGVLYAYPVVQITIILVVCLILLIYTLAIRPFAFTVVLVIEIITQIMLIIALIALLVSISYEKSGCFTCANREGFLCYLMLLMLFGYLLLLALGLLLFSFMVGCCGHSMFYKKGNIPTEIEVSGSQNLSRMAEINHVSQTNYNTQVANNYGNNLAYGTTAVGLAGATAAGYQGITNSGENYRDQVFHKEVVINEEKNESFKYAENKEESHSEKVLSQTEEVIITKADMLMEESDEDQGEFEFRRRNERTIYEFDRDIKAKVTNDQSLAYEGHGQYVSGRAGLDNSMLDRTMTMKVDTDDERVKQNKVLHALSVSEINNQDLEHNQNQINQAKKVIEMQKRSHMTSRLPQYDEIDMDRYSRRVDRETREFHLGHDFDGTSHRNVGARRFEGGSDYGAEKEFLSETGVVKTRVQSQAVREGYDSRGRDDSGYYRQEYEERRYTQNK